MLYNPKYLEYQPIFTDKESALLDDLNKKLSLDMFIGKKGLIEKLGFDFIYTSAQIEGNTYTKADTLALLEYGRTAGGKKYSDAKMILNLKVAYEKYVSQNSQVSLKTVKDFHHIVSNELIREDERGVVRDGSIDGIKGSDYIPLAQSQRLDSEIKYLFEVYENIQNPYDKALYLHNNLAYLQYFRDCNKRTARIMLNISLKQNGKMILIPREEFISAYIDGVLQYYDSGEYAKSKQFFISNYEKVTSYYLQTIQ